MIGSLIRPDIMFVVCVCARHQVTPKECHLYAVKRIFRKSTTGGCQFLGRKLISWQCKKQTIVATSTTEAEYVVAASGCGQVLWIQNQLLDYWYNFMNTKIYIDINNNNVANLLTKPFDVGRFQYLVAEHVMKRLLWCIKSGITSCSDEPASPPRDDSHEEAFPTATSLDAGPPVPPVSLFVPTVAATASEKDSITVVITTTTVVTPYTKRTRASRGVVMTSSSPIPISKEDKGKGIMTEPAKPTKQKVQEQMSEHLARKLEEEFSQENQRLREQTTRDAEIARLHTERELKMMIDELDRSNEVIAKHLNEYAQAEDVLSLEDKIELITELAKY
ncbi:hypothetical protein Tco_0956967 [Tanacetum coccineum]